MATVNDLIDGFRISDLLLERKRPSVQYTTYLFFCAVLAFPTHNKRTTQTGLKHPRLWELACSETGGPQVHLCRGCSRNPTTNPLHLRSALPLRFTYPLGGGSGIRGSRFFNNWNNDPIRADNLWIYSLLLRGSLQIFNLWTCFVMHITFKPIQVSRLFAIIKSHDKLQFWNVVLYRRDSKTIIFILQIFLRTREETY